MSRLKVLNEDIDDPIAATALREYTEDRAQILEQLTKVFLAEPEIRSMGMWGSFGCGEADDLSDLDIWIAVADEFMPVIGSRLLEICHWPVSGPWEENPNCARLMAAILERATVLVMEWSISISIGSRYRQLTKYQISRNK